MCCVIDVGDAKIFVLTVIFSCGCVQTVIKRSRNAAQLTLFPSGYPDWTTPSWEQRKLGEFSKKITTKNADGGLSETFTNSAEQGVISQLDYFDHDITNNANISGYYVVQPDNFVYNPRISVTAPCGPINRNRLNRAGVMSPLYTVFSVDESVDKAYLEHYFKTSRWHDFMFLEGNSGARSDRFSISDATFFEMPIWCPKIPEQRAIAKQLETTDSLITLHQRKCQYRGLYGYLSWEQRKLGEVGEIYTGNTPAADNPIYYSNDGIPWITPSDIVDFDTSKPAKYLSEEGLKVGRTVPAGSIMCTCIASIGKNTITSTTCGFNQQINALVPNKEQYDSNFLFAESYLWSQTMKRGAAAGTMQIVNKTEFSELSILKPSLIEQQAIGSFFSRLDHLITLHQ